MNSQNIEKFKKSYLFFLKSKKHYKDTIAYETELDLVNMNYSSEEIQNIKQKIKLEYELKECQEPEENGWKLTYDILGDPDPNSPDYNGGWDNLPD